MTEQATEPDTSQTETTTQVDGNQTETQETPDDPMQPYMSDGKIFGKYESPADLAKAHKNLESLLGLNPSEREAKVAQIRGEPARNEFESMEQVIEEAGLTTEDITEQWSKEGKLTDEQYKAFGKRGVGRNIVDSLIRGAQAEAQLKDMTTRNIQARLVHEMGSQQALDNLLEWASSLPERVRSEMNEWLADPELAIEAVQNLRARHQQAVGAGQAKPLIRSGETATTSSKGGFETREQALNAMRESEKQYGKGNWHKDQALMERLKNTKGGVMNAL